MCPPGELFRKLQMRQTRLPISRPHQAPVLVKDKVKDPMLNLHRLPKPPGNLVHVLPNRVTAQNQLPTVRVPNNIPVVRGDSLEARASWQQGLGPALVASEVVRLNIQRRNQKVPVEEFLVEFHRRTTARHTNHLIPAGRGPSRADPDALLLPPVNVLS